MEGMVEGEAMVEQGVYGSRENTVVGEDMVVQNGCGSTRRVRQWGKVW